MQTDAVILYADDAGLPADTAEDLALSVQLFVEFQRHAIQLFVSTSKTVLVVFHPAQDTGVIYCDWRVIVNGAEVCVQVYGQQITAVSSFKYLGVHLQANAGCSEHVDARLEAFRRASGVLLNGLRGIPRYSHSF